MSMSAGFHRVICDLHKICFIFICEKFKFRVGHLLFKHRVVRRVSEQKVNIVLMFLTRHKTVLRWPLDESFCVHITDVRHCNIQCFGHHERIYAEIIGYIGKINYRTSSTFWIGVSAFFFATSLPYTEEDFDTGRSWNIFSKTFQWDIVAIAPAERSRNIFKRRLCRLHSLHLQVQVLMVEWF